MTSLDSQPPTPAQPGEGPLDDPTPFHHLERLALVPLRLRDDLPHPAAELLGPPGDPAVVDIVSPVQYFLQLPEETGAGHPGHRSHESVGTE